MRYLVAQQRTGVRFVYWLIGIVSGLVLAGCTAAMDVTILPDEQWEGIISMDLPAEMVESMGGIDELRDQTESEAMSDEDFSPEDVRIEETENGGARIIGEASGQGFDSLNENFFESSATISTNEQGHVTINHTYDQQGGMGLTMIVKLSGSEIIESNADQVEGSTATWTNPSEVQVTLVPGRPGGGVPGAANFFLIIAALVGVVIVLGLVAIGIIFLVRRKQQDPPQSPQPPMQSS
jgi:hypothetical protein